MCGLYGCIGKGWNLGTLRALAILNRERGTDSIGFFDSSGKMIKCAVDPAQALRKENISRWLDHSCYGSEKADASWFVAGHTRAATHGAVNRQNSHPFRYGKYIGSHNGMVGAPANYTVDSMVLIDALSKADGDYQKALADISGYWGLTWYDGESFFVQVHHGDLTLAQVGGVWYYSSSWAHLEACIGHSTTAITLKEGETLKFTPVAGEDRIEMTVMPKLVSNANTYTKYNYNNYDYDDAAEQWVGGTGTYRQKHSRGGKGWYNETQGSGNTNYATGAETSRDYDQEWRTAWEDYCSESEHAEV